MKAVVMTAQGGPEVIELVELSEPEPGPAEVLVEVAAAGVNFMDTGVLRGLAWADIPNPKVLGVEGAGRVISVGHGVDHLTPGDRVAWVYAPGSYAERAVIPADALVQIPDAIDDRTAAAVMMQGLTASHFATDFYPAQPGDIALVHAAAGGLGLLLTQIIKLKGGHVIGRVSAAEKAAIAKEAGADHVIVDTEGRFAQDVLRLSGGDGVHVVYDGSGPTTFQGSLDSLRRSGTFCWYGPVLGAPRSARYHEPAEEHQDRVCRLFRSYPHTGTASRPHRTIVRLDRERGPEGPDRRYLSACRGSTGACRYGKPSHDRQAYAHPANFRSLKARRSFHYCFDRYSQHKLEPSYVHNNRSAAQGGAVGGDRAKATRRRRACSQDPSPRPTRPKQPTVSRMPHNFLKDFR